MTSLKDADMDTGEGRSIGGDASPSDRPPQAAMWLSSDTTPCPQLPQHLHPRPWPTTGAILAV
jgi:hypothetical protein